MRTIRLCKPLLLVIALLAAVMIPAIAASPAQAADGRHCVINVLGTDEDGNFITDEMTCYSTFARVLASRGLVGLDVSLSPLNVSAAVLLSSGIIGVHYDGTNASGASLSVEGSDCNGGGLNLPASWNDRISSTTNGCPTITHYEHVNYAGGIAVTTGVGSNTNIGGSMNNKTSSIKYFS